MKNDRRFILVPITENQILSIFGKSKFIDSMKDVLCINEYKLEGIPDTAIVERVYHDHSRMCFYLVVYDTSFEEVKEHEIPPIVSLKIKTTEIRKCGYFIERSSPNNN